MKMNEWQMHDMRCMINDEDDNDDANDNDDDNGDDDTGAMIVQEELWSRTCPRTWRWRGRWR